MQDLCLFIMQINVDLIYPIGSIYMTTSTVSPAVLFGGTWERITNDAYLKIATGSTAGNLGGTSSEHKIPVSSMPSHTHRIYGYNPGSSTTGQFGNQPLQIKNDTKSQWYSNNPESTGGGQPYYPYYYDVFVWRRTA